LDLKKLVLPWINDFIIYEPVCRSREVEWGISRLLTGIPGETLVAGLHR
jgi:hypothetical protein